MGTLTKTTRILPRRSAVAVAVLATVAVMAAGPGLAAPAQAWWEVVSLASPLENTVAYGINDRGDVVGAETLGPPDSSRAFVWTRNTGRINLDLSPFHGNPSTFAAINDAGRIAGTARRLDSGRLDGVLVGGGLGGLSWTVGSQGDAYLYGINQTGESVGQYRTNGAWIAFLAGLNAGAELAPFAAGVDTAARDLNRAGVIVGYDGAGRALRWTSPSSVQALPRLQGGGRGDYAVAINEAGTIVGESGGRAVKWEAGQVIDLNAPGTGFARGMDVNGNGWVVGFGTTTTSAQAFLHVPGRGSTAVLDLPGVREQGWIAMVEANAINERGQFVGYGKLSEPGNGVAYRATLGRTVWELRDSSGSWDDSASWSYGLAPGVLQHAVIDPTRAISVWGPRGAVEVKRLTVGGGRDGGGGVATLRLDGGTIQVVEDAADTSPGFRGMNIGTRGVLTGDGRIVVAPGGGRAVWNDGVILADAVRVEGTVVNRGVIGGALGQIAGAPRLEATFISNLGAFGSETGTGGVIRVLEGQQLQLEGNLRNSGDVQVFGGSFTHRGGWFNNDSITVPTGQDVGRILGQNARLDFQGGLGIYGGQLVFSAGNNNAFGSIVVGRSPADQRGGQIIVTGRSQATFYGGVDVGAGAELRISSGSVATFLGQVRQRTGALFTGSGTKFYEGGLAVGNSPGIGIDEGDVIFAGSNVYEAEIGGTVPGTQHDKLIVRGLLAFGGTLQLLPWQGYRGVVGDTYDLFDWGTTEGQFDHIDDSAFTLESGAWLDYSQLYIDGTVRVAAVPEPGTWALLALGLAAVGARAWRATTRRKQEARS